MKKKRVLHIHMKTEQAYILLRFENRVFLNMQMNTDTFEYGTYLVRFVFSMNTENGIGLN